MRQPPPARGFDPVEFEKRTKNAQSLMTEQGLDGLLVMTEAEVRYFTGFITPFWQSPTRPWFVFIPLIGKPIAIIPEIGADLMRKSWLDDIRTWNAPNPTDDGITLLSDILVPMGQRRQTLGVMLGHETHLRMPLQNWQTLMSRAEGLKISDATSLVQSLRMVKSTAELEKLRHICAVGSDTFSKVSEFAAAGTPLDEVFRNFKIAALSTGADDAPYVVGSAGPAGYRDVISPPSDRPLAMGDVLMLDTGCCWDGYYCDFDRNWSVGAPSRQVERAYDVLWRATQAGLDAAKPGATCRDIAVTMAGVIQELDPTGGSIGRLGHGLGMQLTEQPSLASFDETVLTEGMVLTLEPSLSYDNGLMMVHEENIVLTNQGAELLTDRAPLEIPVIH